MNKEQTVFIVDDEPRIREALAELLKTVGQACEFYSSAFEFLEDFDITRQGCLLLDIRMPIMTGLELQEKLNQRHSPLPIVFISGYGDIPMAVEAMRRGAVDFICKPFREQDLLSSINMALTIDRHQRNSVMDVQQILDRLCLLSNREREIFNRITEGEMNKVIAQDLHLSERTIEAHRSQVMKKMGAKTLAHLVRLKVKAGL